MSTTTSDILKDIEATYEKQMKTMQYNANLPTHLNDMSDEKVIESKLAKLQAQYDQQLAVTAEERAARLAAQIKIDIFDNVIKSTLATLQAQYDRQLSVTAEERAAQLVTQIKIDELLAKLKDMSDNGIESRLATLQASYEQQLAVTADERAAQLETIKKEQEKLKSQLFDSPCPKCLAIPLEENRVANEDYELCCGKCKTLYKNKRPELPYKKLVVGELYSDKKELNITMHPLETANHIQCMLLSEPLLPCYV